MQLTGLHGWNILQSMYIDNIMHILSQVVLITVHEQVGIFKFDKSCQFGYVCIWQGSECFPVCCVQWSHLSEWPIPPSGPECTGGSGISHDRHTAWGRGVTGQGQLWWEYAVLVCDGIVVGCYSTCVPRCVVHGPRGVSSPQAECDLCFFSLSQQVYVHCDRQWSGKAHTAPMPCHVCVCVWNCRWGSLHPSTCSELCVRVCLVMQTPGPEHRVPSPPEAQYVMIVQCVCVCVRACVCTAIVVLCCVCVVQFGWHGEAGCRRSQPRDCCGQWTHLVLSGNVVTMYITDEAVMWVRCLRQLSWYPSVQLKGAPMHLMLFLHTWLH